MATADPSTMQLLTQSRDGDSEAMQLLFSRLYPVLREIAHRKLQRYRPAETLHTTALVHEAYLKLIGSPELQLRDRAHFLALSARVMRSVVVDYARERGASKRGGDLVAVPLDSLQIAVDERATDLLELDDALCRLARYSERLAEVVEYRFFGGLTFEEIASTLGCSLATVKRDWSRARLWLQRLMSPT
jgi:RNA polymerase sigma factor (TIGR02999 family)